MGKVIYEIHYTLRALRFTNAIAVGRYQTKSKAKQHSEQHNRRAGSQCVFRIDRGSTPENCGSTNTLLLSPGAQFKMENGAPIR